MNANTPVPYPGALSMASAATLRPGTIISAQSVAADASVTTPEMTNIRWRGVAILVDVNSVGTGGTVTVKVQVYDPSGDVWVDLPDATTGALNAAGQRLLNIHPGADEDANNQIATQLPMRWRVVASVATDTVNFSVSAFYLS